ncbi:MAG: hypothetical protein M0Z59_10535 [Nitrospiraceae bacterium]|nr:hypothetical protein [Nitrospiraceae bacterium]
MRKKLLHGIALSEVHGTPLHEAASSVLEKFSHLKKATVEAPTIGRVEVSMGENGKSDEE